MSRRHVFVPVEGCASSSRACRAGTLPLAVLAAVLPASGAAHSGQSPTPETIWSAWNWDPVTVMLLVTGVFLFWRGTRRIWSRVGPGRGVRMYQALAFGGAMLALFVAIVSPADALAEALFSAHMVQHLILMLIAAPLLVIARPAVPAINALPRTWRKAIARSFAQGTTARRAWSALTVPVVAWAVHGVTIWIWHLPALYDAAVESWIAHSLEHAMFLCTAVLFWWTIIPSGRPGVSPHYGIAVLSLFTTAIHSGLLAALITFSRSAWYTSYQEPVGAWGLTPLQDQQLAGVIMWVPMGTIYVLAAAIVLAAGLRRMEAETEEFDATLAPDKRSPELG